MRHNLAADRDGVDNSGGARWIPGTFTMTRSRLIAPETFIQAFTLLRHPFGINHAHRHVSSRPIAPLVMRFFPVFWRPKSILTRKSFSRLLFVCKPLRFWYFWLAHILAWRATTTTTPTGQLVRLWSRKSLRPKAPRNPEGNSSFSLFSSGFRFRNAWSLLDCIEPAHGLAASFVFEQRISGSSADAKRWKASRSPRGLTQSPLAHVAQNSRH